MNADTKNAETNTACSCTNCVGAACTCGCQAASTAKPTGCQCGCQQGNTCRCGKG
jgi:hypothetical protein